MHQEVSARTVEEAVGLALEQMGLERSQVEVEVLDEGSPGLFGLGGRDARVRVVQRAPVGDEDAAALGKEVLEQLLALMKVEGEVATKRGLGGEEGEGAPPLVLNVTGEDLGILIGRRGETLSSLQYMVNLMVSRRLKSSAGLVVDVEGYKERRRESLRNLAFRVAERVRSTGRPVTLEPMPAAERRIVHLALHDDPDVMTQSVGEGESRKVSVAPKRGSGYRSA
jgi:spoIIIJ-associated protein